MPVPVRVLALGALGAALAGGSLIAQSYFSGGEGSSGARTQVCLSRDYSVQDGCRTATHTLSRMEFGRAYIVTDVGDLAGVDQYTLEYRNSDGSVAQLGVLSLSTSKVPRYVLAIEDIDGNRSGPPKLGTYELVTDSAGKQASYTFTVTAD